VVRVPISPKEKSLIFLSEIIGKEEVEFFLKRKFLDIYDAKNDAFYRVWLNKKVQKICKGLNCYYVAWDGTIVEKNLPFFDSVGIFYIWVNHDPKKVDKYKECGKIAFTHYPN